MPENVTVINESQSATKQPEKQAQTQTPAPAQGATESTVDYKARLAEFEAEAAKRTREHVIERRKWSAEKQGLGQKLTEYETLKKEKAE